MIISLVLAAVGILAGAGLVYWALFGQQKPTKKPRAISVKNADEWKSAIYNPKEFRRPRR